MAMKLRLGAENWEKGKCVSQPPKKGGENDIWFDHEDEALDICNGAYDGIICPLRDKCLTFALTNNINDGVWGGMYTYDRTAMRRWGHRDDWGWHPPTDEDDKASRMFHPQIPADDVEEEEEDEE